MSKIGEQITSTALEILKNNPEGVRNAELVRKISAANDSFKVNTIHGFGIFRNSSPTKFISRRVACFA